MKTKRIISLLLCCLLFASSVGYCSATYQISENEMQKLENNSKRLSEINTILQLGSTESQKTLLKVSEELKQSQAELQTLKAELQKLQDSLQIAKNLSQSQQDLLTQTNESFKAYAKEQKQLQNKLKVERDIGFVLAIVAGVFAVKK